MNCLVCTGEMVDFASGEVLSDQPVHYVRCNTCGLIVAENPTWLERSYSDAITKLDVGLLARCLTLSNITAAVLRSEKLRKGKFLDWAGGYGTLTRLMRDRGYDFLHNEPMADNLFAGGFEGEMLDDHYDLVTAIEVLEHLPDPVAALQPVADSTRMLLATTEMLPSPPPKPQDWWYYTPETGQHITFYTPSTLTALAQRLGFDGVASGSFVHLFYRGKVSSATAALIKSPKVAYMAGIGTALLDRRHSLTQQDMELNKTRSI